MFSQRSSDPVAIQQVLLEYGDGNVVLNEPTSALGPELCVGEVS